MSNLRTEIADLALSLKADVDAIYQASASSMPTSRRQAAVDSICAIRPKARRWRKLMVQLIALERAEAAAEAARAAKLAATCVGSTSSPRSGALAGA